MSLAYDSAYHCQCKLTLSCGRNVTLKSLNQSLTYAGLLEGVPSKRHNDQRLHNLIEQVRSGGDFPATIPFLIPPLRREYLRRPGDMNDLPTRQKPEWMPMVTCIGWFTSFPPAKDPEMHSSSLAVIWLQEDYAMPIAADVLTAIRTIDWNSHATDFDY